MDEKSYDQMPIKFWGYYAYWNFPKHSLGYSGVAIFSKYPAIQMF
jgi:exonuclease III